MTEKIDARLKGIVRTYPKSQIRVVLEALNDPASLKSLVESVNGIFFEKALKYAAIEVQAANLKELAREAEVSKIWYVDPRIFESYFNILKAVEYLLPFSKKGVKVSNLSLGPPLDYPGSLRFNPDEPVNVATRALYDAGITVVFSAGNYGQMGNDTLNPWSVAPWVIGVGAATKDGKKLADFSSRGIPGDKLYKPTVVGPGIDVVTIHPSNAKKTQKQIAKDKKFIPAEKLDRYTVVSGTSMAAADISGAIGNIIGFMDYNLGLRQVGNITVFDMDMGLPKKAKIKISVNGYEKKITVKINPSSTLPSNIKNLLIQCAIPMEGYQPHEVGAGFISQAITAKVFGSYDKKIMPIKII